MNKQNSMAGTSQQYLPASVAVLTDKIGALVIDGRAVEVPIDPATNDFITENAYIPTKYGCAAKAQARADGTELLRVQFCGGKGGNRSYGHVFAPAVKSEVTEWIGEVFESLRVASGTFI